MKKTKEKLMEEFFEMRAMEEAAKKFYGEIIADPEVQDENVKHIFTGIQKDEERHMKLVDEILQIIKK